MILAFENYANIKSRSRLFANIFRMAASLGERISSEDTSKLVSDGESFA